jgi:ABC-type branched-subunit amino acid transport system substrate-binding protein
VRTRGGRAVLPSSWTGPLSFVGIANANVAKMVINDIKAQGGLLGRQIDLYLEDSATIDSVAEAKATKLVQHDNVDVIFGGIYSSTRQAIKGPAVVKGRKLYIYPEQYEGQERDALISSAPARCRRSRSIRSSPG